MPSISIDTFFACALMVSVVVISIALSAGILTTRINSLQNLNEDEYFRAISEYIISNSGTPDNWGSNSNIIPDTLGLAKKNSLYPNELDIDKVCRLNSPNAFALQYIDILKAARLKDTALGVSISQIMNISISLSSNQTSAYSTTYTFKIHVTNDGTPVATSLHYYIIARNFLSDAFNNTSDDGTSYIDAEIPNTSNGTASLITFARANYDSRITAYQVYSFGHLSPEPSHNVAFLNMNPLNYTLSISPNRSNTTLDNLYAFSYAYQFNLTLTSNETYAIPTVLENSPIVLTTSGSNGSDYFIEWTSYPQIPSNAGPSFQNSECHTFYYIVTIKNTLYKLTLRFGGISP
jgi:hypothetical protein